MMFRYGQSGFCTTYSFNILVSERKYENNIKNRESRKKQNKKILIYMFMKCFTKKSRGFNKILKISVFFESVLSSRSENTDHVIRYHVKMFSEMRNETPLQL